MRHRTLILVLFVLAAFMAGCLFGWRARISTEEVIVHPLRMLPPVPDDLAWRDVRLDSIEAVLRSRHA